MIIAEKCYEKAIKILKDNSTEHGILACAPSKVAEKRNYLSVFGRDTSICSLGMILSGERELIKSTKASLATLAKYQEPNGQIPTYVKPLQKKSSFWYTSSIDSTLWWLIAINFYDKYSKDRKKLRVRFKRQIDLAISFLLARENPNFGLVEHNAAADWADIMPRSGYVLNANTLWYRVKELYNLNDKKLTKDNFNYLFDQSSKLPVKSKKENTRLARVISFVKRKSVFNYYLSFVNYSEYPEKEDIDVYGNLLAIIFGLSSKINQKKFLKYAIKNKADDKLLVKATFKPITKKSKFWKEYMLMHNQNLPHKYHNGGIWPFIGGFWVIALYEAGLKREAQEALEKLALTNKKNNWSFNEWFHGKTLRAMGKADQSWNAGMYVAAYEVINKHKSIL